MVRTGLCGRSWLDFFGKSELLWFLLVNLFSVFLLFFFSAPQSVCVCDVGVSAYILLFPPHFAFTPALNLLVSTSLLPVSFPICTCV